MARGFNHNTVQGHKRVVWGILSVLLLVGVTPAAFATQVSGAIDSPADGAQVSGALSLSGWAAAGGEPVSSVYLTWRHERGARGVVRTASGWARPTAGPGAVSFVAAIDSLQFPNGRVDFEIVANRRRVAGAAGTATDASSVLSIVVANVRGIQPPVVVVEAPARWQVVEGPFLVRGLVEAEGGVLAERVRVHVNGVALEDCGERRRCVPFTGRYGYTNGDGARLPGAPPTFRPFETIVDPRGMMAPGVNRIGIEVRDGAGRSTLVERWVTYEGGSHSVSPAGMVERPTSPSQPGAAIDLLGWAVDDSEIAETYLVNEELGIRVELAGGLPRPDVQALYAAIAPSAGLGFAASLDLSAFGAAAYDFAVRVVTADGGAVDLPLPLVLR